MGAGDNAREQRKWPSDWAGSDAFIRNRTRRKAMVLLCF